MLLIVGGIHPGLLLQALALSGNLQSVTVQHPNVPSLMALPYLCEANGKTSGSKQGKGNRAMQRRARKQKQKLRAKKIAKGAKNRR